MYPLILRDGSIHLPGLSKKSAVCVVANTCGKTTCATSGVLEREYAHADLYICRRRMFSTSRAITADRDRTETVAVRNGDVGHILLILDPADRWRKMKLSLNNSDPAQTGIM